MFRTASVAKWLTATARDELLLPEREPLARGDDRHQQQALVVLLALRRITLKTFIPFGPFLIIGALWAILVLQ